MNSCKAVTPAGVDRPKESFVETLATEPPAIKQILASTTPSLSSAGGGYAGAARP